MKGRIKWPLIGVFLLTTLFVVYASEGASTSTEEVRKMLPGAVSKEMDRRVTVLGPQGRPPSIPLIPMAPRPDRLAGKTVYFVDVRFMNGDVLLKEMQKVFAERYPEVKTEFRQKRGGYTEDDPKLWAEIKEKGGVMVMAIGH